MQQPTATMAAPMPFDRRPSTAFAADFPAHADPRLSTVHTFTSDHHPHHNHHPHHLLESQSSSFNAGYQYTSGKTPFDQHLAFDGASGSNVPSWLFSSAQDRAAANIPEAALPFSLDSYHQSQHAPAAVSSSLTGAPVPRVTANGPEHTSTQVQPASTYPPVAASEPAPFVVHAQPSMGAASLPLAPAAPLASSDRRPSNESAGMLTAPMPMSEAGSSIAAMPSQAHIGSGPESVGLNGSISPTSSARMSGSPEAVAAPHMYPGFATSSSLPPGGMVMGAAPSASMLESIESWLAPAPVAATNNGAHVTAGSMPTKANGVTGARKISPADPSTTGGVSLSTRASTGNAFPPGSSGSNSASAASSVPFKTSVERRERNKASQRESRKRKQDRMETLETENAALRKALADMKKFSHALSNGAGIRGEDGAEVAPIQMTKFTGAFHLDLIESHLDDETAEAEWKGMVGHRFPAQPSSAQDWDGPLPGIAASSTSDSDEEQSRDGAHEHGCNGSRPSQGAMAVKSEGASTSTSEAGDGSLEASQSGSRPSKKAMWEISLNQRRQKAAQSFPSMVAVPELVLYKVCRLYFSTLLPFTTKLKSGIINLRAAREAPGFIGSYDDLPRFPGDPSFGDTELYLPKNLMPTEMQMRIGFHPVEIAVLPYPSMRDRILTILSAFHAIEELAQEEEDAARFSEDGGQDKSAANGAQKERERQQEQQDGSENDPNTELHDEDIRKRTAMVADMSKWKPKDYTGAVVIPDKRRVYSYGFLEKPKGSHRLRKPAQRWLDEFFLEVVRTLRVWSPAGDVFDGECFEFKESFFHKYPYMVDGEILRATNRWRRARGEDPIRL